MKSILTYQTNPHTNTMSEYVDAVQSLCYTICLDCVDELDEIINAVDNYMDEYNMYLEEAVNFACSDYGISSTSILRDAIHMAYRIALL